MRGGEERGGESGREGGYERDASRVVLCNEVFTERSLKKIQGHLK